MKIKSCHSTLQKALILLVLGIPVAGFSDEKRSDIKLSFFANFPTLTTSVSNNSSSIDYKTNNGVIPNVGVSYGKYGFSIGLGSGSTDKNIAVSTTNRDFQGFYYFEKHGVDFYYQEYKGYYIDKTPLQAEDYFPNLRLKTYTLNYYYKLGGSNALSAMSKEIPSSKSLSSLYYLIASLSDRSLNNSKSIIPQNEVANFPELKKFQILNATLAAGVYYPMHWRNWYLNPGIAVGYGIPLKRFSDNLNTSFTVKVNLKLSMGYAGKTYGFGLIVADDSDAFEGKNNNAIQFQSLTVSLILISYTF